MPPPDSVRVVADLTARAGPKTLSGTFALEVDGRRIYGVRLTDATKDEVDETLAEITLAAIEAGVEAPDDDEEPPGE